MISRRADHGIASSGESGVWPYRSLYPGRPRPTPCLQPHALECAVGRATTDHCRQADEPTRRRERLCRPRARTRSSGRLPAVSRSRGQSPQRPHGCRQMSQGGGSGIQLTPASGCWSSVTSSRSSLGTQIVRPIVQPPGCAGGRGHWSITRFSVLVNRFACSFVTHWFRQSPDSWRLNF